MRNKRKSDRFRKEAEYWNRFEKKAEEYGIPIWVDFRKANTPEIPFINFSTDPDIDHAYLGGIKRKVIKHVNKGKVLDLGCGAGWLCLEFARKGVQVKGIDISPERIELARKYAEKENVRIDYSVENIEDYEWADREEYDAIINWNSLHHVEDVEKTLGHIKKSLKKGGLFISWDHIGDNFLIRFAAKVAYFIPGYYKQKTDILGTIHSAAEGIAKVRVKKKIVAKFLNIEEYEERFAFVHLIPPVYKFIKYKLHIPFPKMLITKILKAVVLIDVAATRLIPGIGTYSFVVAKKE